MTNSNKFYLAGPMTGIPKFNVPVFEAATKDLRSRGYNITSPAELDSPAVKKAASESADGLLVDGKIGGETWGDILAKDVKLIADELTAVVVLDGWAGSRGANLEVFVAMTCGYPLYKYAPTMDGALREMTYREAIGGISARLFG